jgi:hypothetical protein
MVFTGVLGAIPLPAYIPKHMSATVTTGQAALSTATNRTARSTVRTATQIGKNVISSSKPSNPSVSTSNSSVITIPQGAIRCNNANHNMCLGYHYAVFI